MSEDNEKNILTPAEIEAKIKDFLYELLTSPEKEFLGNWLQYDKKIPFGDGKAYITAEHTKIIVASGVTG